MTRRAQLYAHLSHKSIGYSESDGVSPVCERRSLFLCPGRGEHAPTEEKGDAPVCASRGRRKGATAAPRNNPPFHTLRSRTHGHPEVPQEIFRDRDPRLRWPSSTDLNLLCDVPRPGHTSFFALGTHGRMLGSVRLCRGYARRVSLARPRQKNGPRELPALRAAVRNS
jgi:hypothetical protein